MDPITLASLSIGLGAALTKLAEIIVEKTVELGIEPTIDAARQKILKGTHKAQADQELRDTIMAALDEMRADTPQPHERLKITNWVTGQTPETYMLMAATAVEMVDLDPKRITGRLLTALRLDNNQRDLLARFLAYLRQKLAGTGNYGSLIAYANDLDKLDSLTGLTKEVESIAQDTRRVKSLMEQWVTQQGLTDDDAKALAAYLQHCRERWGRLMLPLVRKNVGVISTNLKRVFVPLVVRDAKAEEEAREETKRRGMRTRLDEPQAQVQPLDFYNAIAKYKHFIVVGLPGSGKTTLLRRAALAFAEGRAGEDLGWQGDPKLPIFVRLRNFGIYLAENREKFSAPGAGALVAYLEQNLRNDEGIELPHDFFERRLTSGGCLVLLDGLDEVLENRVAVAQYANAFIQKYGQYDNRIGLSSRPRGYEGDTLLQLRQSDLALLEVLPLAPAGIRDLISKLLPLLVAESHQRQKDYSRLTGRILSNKNLTEIASVPLFCSALVQVYKYHQADLPQRRVDVLSEIVDLLLGFWYAQQTEIRDPEKLAQTDGTGRQYIETQESVEQKLNRLAYLAHAMQSEIGQAEISANEAQERVAAYLEGHEGITPGEARRWARSFLRNAHEQSGLFVESSPGRHTFLHKNIMEFFAATALIIEQEEPLEIIKAHIDDEWWEPVLLLAAAHPKATNPLRRKLMPAMLECAGECEKGSPAWERRLRLAGEMARDMTTRLPAPQRQEIEHVLYAAATDLELPPTTRANLADSLDQFYQIPDLYAFIKIEAEPSAFFIAKYPVTNTQYERFLQPENFGNPSLWSKIPRFSTPDKAGKVKLLGQTNLEGWKWLQAALKEEDNQVENGVLYPSFWRDTRFGIARPTVPVVGVSWWETNAYCKWLCMRWDELEESQQGIPKPRLIRLTSEPEWSLAGGGERPTTRYAWDHEEATESNEDILQRANINESGIGRTTPVWMYPLGASPAGVMDLSGNVWEWQVNYRNQKEGWLGLRGGSWEDDLDSARVSERNYDLPGTGYDLIGFRVVSPPI